MDAVNVSRQQIRAFDNEDLSLIATGHGDSHPDEVLLAAWEELARRGVVVDFVEQPTFLAEAPSEYLVTVDTFRNYVKAQFAQTRLMASGVQAFLFDDNIVRMNGLWATALGFVKLRVPAADVVEALEILKVHTDWEA